MPDAIMISPPATLAPASPRAILDEICGHLGAAVGQMLPSDDRIICEHVKAAHEFAKLLRDAQPDAHTRAEIAA